MAPKLCTKGRKKSAKLVRGLDGKMHCVRYGDPNMSIKKHKPSRKRSFCARHKCSLKKDPATPGFQSCLAWDCEMSSGPASFRHPQKRRKKRVATRHRRSLRTPRTRRTQRRRTRSRTSRRPRRRLISRTPTIAHRKRGTRTRRRV